MNQLALFETLPVPAPVARPTQPAPKQRNADDYSCSGWVVGVVACLPIVAGIEGEKWCQYTMGLRGRIEWIEGDLAGVRVASAGHKFDGKLATVYLRSLSGNN